MNPTNLMNGILKSRQAIGFTEFPTPDDAVRLANAAPRSSFMPLRALVLNEATEDCAQEFIAITLQALKSKLKTIRKYTKMGKAISIRLDDEKLRELESSQFLSNTQFSKKHPPPTNRSGFFGRSLLYGFKVKREGGAVPLGSVLPRRLLKKDQFHEAQLFTALERATIFLRGRGWILEDITRYASPQEVNFTDRRYFALKDLKSTEPSLVPPLPSLGDHIPHELQDSKALPILFPQTPVEPSPLAMASRPLQIIQDYMTYPSGAHFRQPADGDVLAFYAASS